MSGTFKGDNVNRRDTIYRWASNVLLSGVALLLMACGSGTPESNETSSPSMTEKALQDLQQKYDRLTGDRLEDPVKWATDDIENIGDWEYRVVEFGALATTEWEAELNSYGNDRWEVAWVESTPASRVVVFKRPSISLLSKIPLSQLGRMVIGDSGTEQ